jgi:Plasmid pRiA4b ORF-3-like protein
MPSANKSKQVRKPASVTLRIELCDIEPLIWRRIVVPPSWPMSTLYSYLQWVMGWLETHLHEFRVFDKIFLQN